MNDDEQKKLAGAVVPLTSAVDTLTNFKTRAGKASTQAAAKYKQYKKDQPSWKEVAAALERINKSTDATKKAGKKIFDITNDKNSAKLSLADAKKLIKTQMPIFPGNG
jgi:hypothetical protein